MTATLRAFCSRPADKRKNTMADTADTTITHEDIGDDLRRIVITGRLDTPGTNEVSGPLAELAAAPKRGVIVDLMGVEFLTSIGIGQLILNAKAVRAPGGNFVLTVIATSA